MVRYLIQKNNRFYTYHYLTREKKQFDIEMFNFIPGDIQTRLNNSFEKRIIISINDYKRILRYDYNALKEIDLNAP